MAGNKYERRGLIQKGPLWILAAVFLSAAAAKSLQITQFGAAITVLGFIPAWLVPILAVTMIALEWLTGLGMLVQSMNRAACGGTCTNTRWQSPSTCGTCLYCPNTACSTTTINEELYTEPGICYLNNFNKCTCAADPSQQWKDSGTTTPLQGCNGTENCV